MQDVSPLTSCKHHGPRLARKMMRRKTVRITKEEVIDRPNDMMLGSYVRKKMYEETSWIKKLKNFFKKN